MTDSTQIAQTVLDARRDIIEALFAGTEGQELIRLDAAYKALTGKQAPSVGEVLSRNGNKPKSGSTLTVTHAVRVSPKQACRDLMLNGPMRTWTYDDLEAHFDEEDIVLDAQYPRDAIRTAMRNLDQEGIVEKIGRGRFRPVRDHSTGESHEKGEDTPVGERNREGSY